MIKTRLALACVPLALLAAPAPALAVERISGSFLAEYSAKSYVIDQGEIVTFANSDRFLAHGLASDQAGLFDAPVIRQGQTRLVRGAPYLTAGGPYAFHCPIHPGMTAAISVSSAGAPLPPDGTPPTAAIKLKAPSARKLLKRRRLQVTVTPSEPVDVAIAAGVAGASLGRLERTYAAAGSRSFAFRVSAGAARRIAGVLARGGRVRARVKLSLSDAAGNAAAAKRAVQLAGPRRPPGRKR